MCCLRHRFQTKMPLPATGKKLPLTGALKTQDLFFLVVIPRPHGDFGKRRMRGHGFAQGVDRAWIEVTFEGQLAELFDGLGSDVFVDGLYGMLAAHEQVNERLNEDGRFVADDVGTENLVCLLVEHELRKAVVVMPCFKAEGIAFHSRGIMIEGRFRFIALCLRLFFGQADMRGFGVRIGYSGDGFVLGPAPVLGGIALKEVVRENLGFVIRLVAKWSLAIDVANSPDAVSGRLEEFVRPDVAALIELHVRMLEVQQLRHRADPRRDKNFFGAHFGYLAARAVAHCEDLLPVFHAHGNGVLIEAYVDASVLELFEHEVRDFFVFFGQQADIVLDNHDFRAARLKDMREFAANRAAADDDEALVELSGELRAEERLGRHVAGFFEARQLRDIRATARGEENLLSFDFFARAVVFRDEHGLFARKRGRAVVRRDVCKLVVIHLDGRTFVNFMPKALRDGIPIEPDMVGKNANTPAFSRLADEVGGRDHDFRGNAPAVEARAAVTAAFDEGDRLMGADGCVGDDIARARADDDDIILFHGSFPFYNIARKNASLSCTGRHSRKRSVCVRQNNLKDILCDALFFDNRPVMRIILIDIAGIGFVLLLKDVPRTAARVVPEFVNERRSRVLDVVRVVDTDVDVLAVRAVDGRGIDDVFFIDMLLVGRDVRSRADSRRRIDHGDSSQKHGKNILLHLHDAKPSFPQNHGNLHVIQYPPESAGIAIDASGIPYSIQAKRQKDKSYWRGGTWRS